MHQKTMVVDNRIAAVGTHNLDNRSLRLNFEVAALAVDEPFTAEVAAMLEEDFANSSKMSPDEYQQKPWWFKVACRFARLTSPLL